jgi:integrase
MPRGFSVFQRTGRPVWYLKYVSTSTGQWVSEASPFRTDDPAGEKKALRSAEQKAKEFEQTGLARRNERWEVWVRPYLDQRYRNSALTLKRYLGAWDWWQLFLKQNKIPAPGHLTYNFVMAFVSWRQAQKRHCGKNVSLNTALCDVKVMSLLMREAVRRGFAMGNPCERLGIQRDPPKEKLALTTEEIAAIRSAVQQREAALRPRDRWMTASFEIALHQGCRLRETSVPMDLVNEIVGTITFHGKGRNGQKKIITTALHPALLPLMTQLRADGATHTCQLPRMAAKDWWLLRGELNLRHTCFHSTRVTVVTQLARSNVSEQQAMAYVGHSSRLVHRVYQKLRAGDLSGCTAALSFGEPGISGAAEPTRETA